ncbi:MAG: type 11 methyltransferase [Parcubacteria group bacterium Athens0714_26]|nr:MAG: type 11 methyltransferase [Parcubacteria group bacterium Athens0714_26]
MLVNKNNLSPKISLISHDLNQVLPFEENSFDVAVSLANLEHLENPTKNINEIFRVLRPGGLLLLTTPTIYAKPVLEFLSFKLKIVSEEGVRDHKNYFTREKLIGILKNAGFASVRHRYFQLFMNSFIYARK